MSPSKTLTRSLAHFFSGTILSRISGLVRDVVMSAAFGSTPAVALFLAAFRLANLPRRLFGEGAMHAAFIPQYEALQKEGKGDSFFRDVTYALAALMALLVLTLLLLLPSSTPLLRFTRLFLPFLPFICLYGLKLAYHNCQGAYFRPSAAPVFFNLVWIGGSLALWGQQSEGAMRVMALVVGGGFVFQWAVVALPLRKRLSPRGVQPLSPEVRRCGRSLGLAILGVGAAQINSALDPLFAMAADASAPAYLWYAVRLQQLPLALFGVALASVILPALSRVSDKGAYRKMLRWGEGRTFELMAPCTIGIFTCGLPAVALLFFRGQFTSGDSVQTAVCLGFYGIGLVPMALSLLRAAAFHSRGDYQTPALASALAVAVNISLNTLFVYGLGWAGSSVALATSCSAFIQATFLKAHLRERGWEGAFLPWLASLLAGVASVSVDWLVFGEWVWHRPPATHTLQQLLGLGVPALTFLAVYALVMGRRFWRAVSPQPALPSM